MKSKATPWKVGWHAAGAQGSTGGRALIWWRALAVVSALLRIWKMSNSSRGKTFKEPVQILWNPSLLSRLAILESLGLISYLYSSSPQACVLWEKRARWSNTVLSSPQPQPSLTRSFPACSRKGPLRQQGWKVLRQQLRCQLLILRKLKTQRL